ncbi:MAG: response regulator [Planctomycetota bacterium]
MLLVDDDVVFRERLARALRSRGYEVWTAGDGTQALELARRESPERAVVDLRMGSGQSGLDVLRALKAVDPATHVVVLTGYGSIATAVEATKLGATNYLPKPADAEDVLLAFERGITESAASDGAGSDDVGTGGGGEIEAPTLARAEWEHINRVLADCSGNVSEAARRLGIHRRSLQRKLQRYAPDERP